MPDAIIEGRSRNDKKADGESRRGDDKQGPARACEHEGGGLEPRDATPIQSDYGCPRKKYDTPAKTSGATAAAPTAAPDILKYRLFERISSSPTSMASTV